jgi:hypothetical protein
MNKKREKQFLLIGVVTCRLRMTGTLASLALMEQHQLSVEL